jgi:hypothetical protein
MRNKGPGRFCSAFFVRGWRFFSAIWGAREGLFSSIMVKGQGEQPDASNIEERLCTIGKRRF